MALFFPKMLVPPAEAAGIKVPEDAENYKASDFPHWHVFCTVQLGAALPSWTAPHDNASIIASLSEDEVKTIDFPGLLAKGLRICT